MCEHWCNLWITYNYLKNLPYTQISSEYQVCIPSCTLDLSIRMSSHGALTSHAKQNSLSPQPNQLLLLHSLFQLWHHSQPAIQARNCITFHYPPPFLCIHTGIVTMTYHLKLLLRLTTIFVFTFIIPDQLSLVLIQNNNSAIRMYVRHCVEPYIVFSFTYSF